VVVMILFLVYAFFIFRGNEPRSAKSPHSVPT